LGVFARCRSSSAADKRRGRERCPRPRSGGGNHLATR